MARNYFKLLENSHRQSASCEFFTQGYFERFFKVMQVLGRGSNGVVLQVEHILHGLSLGVFALKKISLDQELKSLDEALKEVKFLYQLTNSIQSAGREGSNNVLKYNHVWLEVDSVSSFGPKNPCVFLLFEYCDGGTLEDVLEDLKTEKIDLDEERQIRRRMRKSGSTGSVQDYRKKTRLLNNIEIYKFFVDMVKGVSHLHDIHILHRDLKPSNCFLRWKMSDSMKASSIQSLDEMEGLPELVVGDFGESTLEGFKRRFTGNTGTVEFMAPEVLLKDRDGHVINDFSKETDVYSLGLILYYMMFGELPYESDDPEITMKEILKDYKTSLEEGHFSKLDDLEKLRHLVSAKEFSHQDEILNCWVTLLKKLLHPDPLKRPSCSEILHLMTTDIHSQLSEAYNKPNLDPVENAFGSGFRPIWYIAVIHTLCFCLLFSLSSTVVVYPFASAILSFAQATNGALFAYNLTSGSTLKLSTCWFLILLSALTILRVGTIQLNTII